MHTARLRASEVFAPSRNSEHRLSGLLSESAPCQFTAFPTSLIPILSLPLLWEWLPHGGSSAQSLRTDLLEDLFTLLEPKRVAMLLGDREFIGAAWFETLWL